MRLPVYREPVTHHLLVGPGALTPGPTLMHLSPQLQPLVLPHPSHT